MNTERFGRLLVSLLAGFMLIPTLLLLLSLQSSGTQARAALVTEPFPDAGYCFLQGLITSTTGLVRSREGECYTTVYKNSLAAMAFIRQGDITEAEGIFSFFQSQITTTTPISGFHQTWDACTGQPDNNSDYWEGDNAFLLLALNYYSQTQKAGSYVAYNSLANTLTNALILRANSSDNIIAEGAADMYAALHPFLDDWGKWKLRSRFYNGVDYPNVADHTVRGALVFSDTAGFDFLDNFKRTEIWEFDNSTPITAFAAFSSEDFINVEISAQLLLTWRLWQHDVSADLSSLRFELEKLKIPSQQNPACAGLPYYVRHHRFDNDYSKPIIDPTAYLLYDYWNFNPFTGGTMKAIGPYCPGNKFISLTVEGQQQGFPRFYTVDQDFKNFPQEVNDSGHTSIVIEFTTSRDLSQVPITFTVDTVARGATFSTTVKLDDGNHCLGVCDRSGIYANSDVSGTLLLSGCKRVFLPVIANSMTGTFAQPLLPTSSYSYTYQLVLEGTSGWGVFDWLRLETPDQVLWTIGYQDNRCSEFDNNGFVYKCE